ncbi:MAG: hypothetical protein VXX91_07950 [Planctomycetota bacterium]|nr:hypothetical protein [Planctomycetota bacterium]
MSVVFFAGLPRSSTVGFADLFYQSIELQNQRPLMTGHLHLAAALTNHDLGQFDSPLNLYRAQEALIGCLLNVHGMTDSLESYLAMLQYYSSSTTGHINRTRLKNSIEDSSLIFIDPSFSHSLHPDYLVGLAELMVDLYLVVVWRNPVAFCSDIKHGVYAFDCCLHWILARNNLSFPLDPLSLWLEFTRSFLQISSRLPKSFVKTYYLYAETIHSHRFAEMSDVFAFNARSKSRITALASVNSILSDCPLSGDPSYYFKHKSDNAFLISLEQLNRFSSNQSVIDEVVSISKAIGYTLVG